MSVITFGTSYVGKVDRVPGTGYVVTKVFQVVNIPLVPLGGYVVAEGTETQTFVSGLQAFEGAPITLSWKSFAWGITRAVLFGGGLLALLGMLVILVGSTGAAAILFGPVLGIAMLATWWLTRRGLRATPARAAEVATLLRSTGLGLQKPAAVIDL